MMRKLTNKEIEEFANRPGAKKIAVENFLMSMGEDLTNAMGNLGLDAKSYKWNRETINAVLEGMLLAAGLDDGDMVII